MIDYEVRVLIYMIVISRLTGREILLLFPVVP